MSATQPTIAVLGTGTIGAPIARNLGSAGFTVAVWNRTPDKAQALASDRVRVASTVEDAARGAQVIITVVKDADAVLDILTAGENVLAADTVLIQISTVGIEGIQRIAGRAKELSLVLVDAPVQGTKGPAENAQLTVLAAGPEDVRDLVQPIFDAIGRATIWISNAAGEASKLKLVVNTYISAITHGTAEAIRLAEALGLDPQLFTSALAGGPLESPFEKIKATAILEGNFSPSFTIDNAVKDSELVAAAAQDANVWLPLADAGLARYRSAQANGHGEDDMAASYYATEQAARS